MEWLEFAAEIVAALTLAAAGWVIRSLRDLSSRLDAAQGVVDDRLDKAEELERHNVIERLGEAERQIASLASQDQLRRIHARIDDDVKARASLGQEISAVAGKVDAIHGTMQVIQKHLMERGGTP